MQFFKGPLVLSPTHGPQMLSRLRCLGEPRLLRSLGEPYRLLGAVSVARCRLSTAVNPLLGVPFEASATRTLGEAPAGEVAAETGKRMARAHYKNLPVSPKKLVILANLTPGLCVDEAMLQMEFSRKQMAVMVKNCLAAAAQNARKHHGIESSNLIVDQAMVGKGSYMKGPDWKSRGRVGILKRYRTHLLITLREASDVEVQRTKFHGRWRQAKKILEEPWEERIQKLPRYQPIPGYTPA